METRKAEIKTQRELEELFLLACARGLLSDVEALTTQGTNIRCKDRCLREGVHFAAHKGELQVLEFLHSRGADLDVEDIDGRSPLHYASMGGREPVVKMLVRKGCWVDAQDKRDDSPLHLAVKGSSQAVVKCLLENNAKPLLQNSRQLTALGEAACAGNRTMCELLCGGEAVQGLKERPNGYGLLHVVAGLGEPMGVKWLLDKGANVNDAQCRGSLTALHCAVPSGSVIVLELLIAAGADCNARNAQGQTAEDLVHETTTHTGSDETEHRRRMSQLLKASSKSSATSNAVEAAASSTPVHSPRKDDSETAAARILAATDPETVAEVMRGLPPDHQRLRLRKWVSLDPEALDEIESLSVHSKRAIAQVKELSQLENKMKSYTALRNNERFQSDMRHGTTRSGVDAVIQDANNVTKYVQVPEVMTCLNHIRSLRDVIQANGGGPIDMDELLSPVTDADVERMRGVHDGLQEAIVCAIDSICNPTKTDTSPPDDAATSQVKHVLDGHAEAEQDQSGSWDDLLPAIRQQALQAVALMVLLLAIVWVKGGLPWQVRERNEFASQESSQGLAGESAFEELLPDL